MAISTPLRTALAPHLGQASPAAQTPAPIAGPQTAVVKGLLASLALGCCLGTSLM